MEFKPAYKENGSQKEDDLAFVFSGANILVNNEFVPKISEVGGFLNDHGISASADGLFFGTIGKSSCYAFELPKDFNPEDYELSSGDGYGVHEFVLLRRYVGELDPDINAAAGNASHLLHWNRHSRFCGRCGAENEWFERERAKFCPSCGNVQFPKISPAIIIMVHKGSDILLAHNRHFPEGRYSLLAGFMEIGETIEQTAMREVKEEVGIEIENVRYFSSQSWPFPDSLMLGLTADYKSGEIVPDGNEIVDADWYNPGNFPNIPGSGTIARKLIDEYTKTQT